MSYNDYKLSQDLQEYPIHALIMAAMRHADTDKLDKLRAAFPETWNELVKRYNAPGGCISEGELFTVYGDTTLNEQVEE